MALVIGSNCGFLSLQIQMVDSAPTIRWLVGPLVRHPVVFRPEVERNPFLSEASGNSIIGQCAYPRGKMKRVSGVGGSPLNFLPATILRSG